MPTTLQDIEKRLDEVWNKHIEMHWLLMEVTLVDILKLCIDDHTKVALVKNCIDAYTKRGHFV